MIIGGACGKIVSSLVNDIIMPLVGLLLGGIDFSNLSWKVGKAVVKYGAFIQTVVDFLIVAGSVFLMVKLINRAKLAEKTAPAAPPAPTNEELLLAHTRVLLKSQQAAARKVANG